MNRIISTAKRLQNSLLLLLSIRNAVNDDDFIPVCMAKVRIQICETINAKTKNNTKNVRVQTKNRWQSV